jgi:ornithine cyclodeaminase
MNLNLKLQFISDTEVAARLTPSLAKQAVIAALTAHALKNFDQPPKPYVRPGGRENEYERGRFISMPAYVGPPVNAVGIKWIASVPANVKRMIPRASAVVILNSLETGQPYAVLDAATLSSRRTAAVAAIAFEHFGQHGAVVSLLGCGPINHEVALALTATGIHLKEFRVFDPKADRAEKFRRGLACQLNTKISVSRSLESCISGAANVIAATTGAKGYIEPAWLNDCRFMLPLSLDDFRAETLLNVDKVIVDDFDQSVREEKLFHHVVRDGRFSREKVYAELGEVVTGLKSGREGDETIYLNAMGMAIEDVATAKAVFDNITTPLTSRKRKKKHGKSNYRPKRRLQNRRLAQ